MDFQHTLNDIMVKLNNLLQISDNMNKTLNRIITKSTPPTEQPQMEPYTTDELIEMVVSNNDMLNRGVTVIKLDPERIKSENAIPLEVTPVFKKSSDLILKDLPDQLLCDIQHAVELILGANLLDLSYPMLNLAMHIELKGQVNELSLEVKQQCLVPIDIHSMRTSFGPIH